MPKNDPGTLRRRPTGILGLDDVMGGGLPEPGIVLVFGGPGTGKSVLCVQALTAAAARGEAGLLVTFEESPQQLRRNFAAFEWDPLPPDGELFQIHDARLPSSVIQSGVFDVAGLLATLGARLDSSQARLVVFDGVDMLLSHLDDPHAEWRELLRIQEWLQQRGLTALLTSKMYGDVPADERHADLPFLADCVVLLRHEVLSGSAHRSLQVLKYRGTHHHASPTPMTISRRGVAVLGPSLVLSDRPMTQERVSSGLADLDEMLSGGYYRGSSILVSGAPGTAKSSLGVCFAAAAVARGESTVLVSFDEPVEQIVRNVASIGIDLATPLADGRLHAHAYRTLAYNANDHVARIHELVELHKPSALVVDPVSALARSSSRRIADEATLRLLDLARRNDVTLLLTTLLERTGDTLREATATSISTLADTWIHLSYAVQAGERNRGLTIVKSRGMGHSNQVRELFLSADGLHLQEVFTAGGEVVMGTLRWEREEEQRDEERRRRSEMELERIRTEMSIQQARTQIESLQHQLTLREEELVRIEENRIETVRQEEARRRSIRGLRNVRHQS